MFKDKIKIVNMLIMSFVPYVFSFKESRCCEAMEKRNIAEIRELHLFDPAPPGQQTVDGEIEVS